MKISDVIPCERLEPGRGAVLQWPHHSRQGVRAEELRVWSERHFPHCLSDGGHRGAGAPSERCHWWRSCWWSWGRECQSCWPSTSWPRISQPEPSSLTWTGPCLPTNSWNIRTLKYFHMNKADLMRISKALGSTSVTVIILMFLANGPCNIALPRTVLKPTELSFFKMICEMLEYFVCSVSPVDCAWRPGSLRLALRSWPLSSLCTVDSRSASFYIIFSFHNRNYFGLTKNVVSISIINNLTRPSSCWNMII